MSRPRQHGHLKRKDSIRFCRPGQEMVSDITYIPTDEGWPYLAGAMGLFTATGPYRISTCFPGQSSYHNKR